LSGSPNVGEPLRKFDLVLTGASKYLSFRYFGQSSVGLGKVAALPDQASMGSDIALRF